MVQAAFAPAATATTPPSVSQTRQVRQPDELRAVHATPGIPYSGLSGRLYEYRIPDLTSDTPTVPPVAESAPVQPLAPQKTTAEHTTGIGDLLIGLLLALLAGALLWLALRRRTYDNR